MGDKEEDKIVDAGGGGEGEEEDEDPAMGNNAITADISDLKKALAEIKLVLSPYDWVEFAQDYETNRALKRK